MIALRSKQQRNLLATLLLSHGVPMILHGDELGRTQGGNNNAYAQDSETTWVHWDSVDEELLQFTAALSRVRAQHATFHRRRFFSGRPVRRESGEQVPDVVWLRPDGFPMTPDDWDSASGRALGLYLNGSGIRCSDLTGSTMTDADFLLYLNASPDAVAFILPREDYTLTWKPAVDTSAQTDRPKLLAAGSAVTVAAHSLLLLQEPVKPVHAADHNVSARGMTLPAWRGHGSDPVTIEATRQHGRQPP